MIEGILTKVDNEISKYKIAHKGNDPLFILVSPHESDDLLDEARKAQGYDADTLVTTYKGIKISKYDALNEGELLLTSELPGD